MDITPVLAEGAQRITAYGDGLIRVNDQDYTAPLLVQITHCSIWENPGLDEPSLTALANRLETTEILLIGTGSQTEFMPPVR